VPAEIAGIGSSATKLRVSPGFDPLKAQVGPDEYFVLSRIDGTQTLREVLLSTGLPVDRGIAIVTKLRSIGALLLPGETAAPMPAMAPTKPGRANTATPSAPLTPPSGVPAIAARQPVPPTGNPWDPPTARGHGTGRIPAASERPPAAPTLDDPTEAEREALAEPCDLALDDRVLILAMARLVDAGDPHALLGVAEGADAKAVKRAYFKLSKEIHPDRYYGKQLGSFRARLTVVFEAVKRGYTRLTDPSRDRASGVYPQVTEQPQTPTEYAAELFDRACGLEVGGDAMDAMKLFAAAVRIDPQTRYLRRAATCALAAGQPKTALEYAKKAQTQAPSDPSAARLLAAAFKAAGRLSDAEEVLVMAMALKSENDVLGAELRNDLAEVRRLLSG
jgi:hypothetical protein